MKVQWFKVRWSKPDPSRFSNTPCKQIQPLNRVKSSDGPRVRRISPVGSGDSKRQQEPIIHKWKPVSHPTAFVKHYIFWPAAVDSASRSVLQKNTHSAHWCVSHIVKFINRNWTETEIGTQPKMKRTRYDYNIKYKNIVKL